MATFDFIASDQMRACLQRDSEELIACMRAGAWKAAHVIAGSLIQATLVDYLVSTGQTSEEGAVRLSLSQLLDVCRSQEVLSPRTLDLASFLRPYSDFLSPATRTRVAASVDETSARIVQALLEIVINEVSTHRRDHYHFTAEQAISKVLSDPSSSAILGHLVTKISRVEMERLMVDLLPKAYFAVLKQDDEHTATTAERLAWCYHLAFGAAPQELKRIVARRFVDVLENESEFVVQTYQTHFFRGGDLAFLDQQQRALVLTHFLAVLQKRPATPLVNAAEGIGPYLESEPEVRGFFVPLVLSLLGEPASIDRAAVEKRILEEAARLSDPHRISILSWMGRLRWSLDKEGRAADSACVARLVAALDAARPAC